MTTDSDPATQPATEQTGLTRRTLLGAAAVAGGASWLLLNDAGSANAAPGGFAELLDPTVNGLTYVSLDAFAFDVAGLSGTAYRLYQESTGMQPQPAGTFIYAPLTIPIGSVVKQINIGYLGQPVISIARRTLGGAVTELTTGTSLTAGGGAKTQSLSVTGELTPGASYAVRAFCSAGDSILGMTIGYIPPAQAFIPFSGTDPRAYDSRPNARLAANTEVVVDLSSRVVPTARAVVINLAADQTGGPGFLAAFRDGITWPGNSSLNFDGANQSISNTVICEMSAGKIKIHAGPSSSHVIVDVIGSLL